MTPDSPDNIKPAIAGDGIVVSNSSWTFDGMVPEVFDVHVSKSIPGYIRGHKLVLELAAPRLAQGGRCYELGCSTGTLTAHLGACTNPDTTELIGLDQIEAMLELARSRCDDFAHVHFELANIADYTFLSSRVIVSYYTLQFIPIPQRITLVAQIFSALEPGGVFLLFEKTHYQDSLRDAEMTEAYHDFKRSQGFSEQEIRAKAAALEGVLIPRTQQENIAMLRSAGFSKVSQVFNELCFQGYLARK